MVSMSGTKGMISQSRAWTRPVLSVVLASMVVFMSGCLNPSLVNNVTGNSLFPTAPGDEPFVLVRIVNRTEARIDTQLSVDKGTGEPTVLTPFIHGNMEFGILFEAPVLQVGIGEIDGNSFLPSSVASFPDGTNISFPFEQGPLVLGRDFQEGDAIVFVFYQDARASKRVRTSVGVEDGSGQTGSSFREDTFTTIRQLLQLNGLLGPIAESRAP